MGDKRRITTKMTPALYKELRKYSIDAERSVLSCVEEAIRDFLKKNGRLNEKP